MKTIICILISLACFCQLKAQTTIYSNDFSSAAGWTLEGPHSSNFDVWLINSIYTCSSTTPNQGGGGYLHVGNDLFYDDCAYSLFAGFGSSGAVDATMNSGFSTVGHSQVTISFDWLCAGQSGGILDSYGSLQYSTNGSTWNDVIFPFSKYYDQATWTSATITSADVPGILNQANVRLRFNWTNSGYGLNPTFSIDNLEVTAGGGPICTNTGGTASASPGSVCSGGTSVLSLSGHIGSIQWQQSVGGPNNWVNVIGGSGANTASYTTAGLTVATYFRAVLSETGCPDQYSNTTVVTVSAQQAVSVSIAANPNGNICGGESVNFTATPSNAGASPTYQWKLNGSNVGSGGTTYTSTSLNDGDVVTCQLTSSLACASGNPATSNSITASVTPSPNPNITATGSINTCGQGTVTLDAGPGFALYFWNNGSATQQITVTSAGTYSVTVLDGPSCSGVGSYTLTGGGNDLVTGLYTDNVTTSSVRFNWTAYAGADHYQVRGRLMGGAVWQTFYVAGGITSSSKAGLPNNKSFEWQVRAWCDLNEVNGTPWSLMDTFTTGCAEMDSAWTNGITHNTVVFNWNPVFGAVGYEIRGRRVGTTGLANLTIPGGGTSSHTVAVLAPSSAYEWTIRALCDATMTQASDFLPNMTFTTNSLKKNDELDEFEGSSMLYPNPANQYVLLPPVLDDLAPYQIYNSAGNLMTEGKLNGTPQRIEISQWPQGIYFFEVKGQTTTRSRLLVMH